MDLKYGPYSPTRMDLATCGFAFFHTYVPQEDGTLPMRAPESVPQARGSAQHEINEYITKRLCADPNADFLAEEVREVVIGAVKRHPAAYEELEAIKDMTRRYLAKPPPVLTRDAEVERKMAIKYAGTKTGWIHVKTRKRHLQFVELPPVPFLVGRSPDGKEVWKEVPALKEATWPHFVECDYDDPTAFARCKIDILTISDDTTAAIIYDHKTQPNIEEADTFQMGFYAWVVSRIYPYLDEVKSVLHFARYGRYSDPYVWSHADLERVEDDILTRAELIEGRESWEATPHKGCQYCPHLTKCPAVSDYLSVSEDGTWKAVPTALGTFGSTAKAVQLAGLINVLEELEKRAKSALKEHVEASNSGIAIPGKIYDFWAGEEQVNWDKVNGSLRPQTYAIFEKHKVDPKTFMGFSQSFSLDIWKLGNEKLLKELSAAWPRKCKTEFRGKKA